jgi:thioester reductase-like protein
MPRSGHDEVLLVTGYPAFGARQLVAHLLRSQPTALVHALVEPEQLDLAQEHRASLEPSSRPRLELHEGSVTRIDLGLSGAEFRRLTGDVDRIHHMAYLAHLDVDRPSAERVNIRGTLEILEFARSCRSLRALIHHSTAFVAGDRKGLVTEDELDAGQRFRNHAEATRAQAEELVRAAQGQLPVVILRPASVVGDSQSGEIDRLDGLYLLVLLVLGAPAEWALPLPSHEAPLHLVPVDYVARAAHAIGRDGRAIGQTFHLVDPAPLPARRAFEMIARSVGRRTRGSIPPPLARAVLAAPGLQRIVRNPRAFFDQLLTPVRFDDTHTAELLADSAIRCPPFESYVDSLVGYVRGRTHEAPGVHVDDARLSLDLDEESIP